MDFFNDFQDFDGVARVNGERCATQEGIGEEPVELGISTPLCGNGTCCT